jgi:putative transposase
LWEGRFKSTVVNSEQYLFTVCRYIELNPVRADMGEHPVEYPWSSYNYNAMGVPIKLITPHPLYLSLGNNKTECQSSYRAMFDTQLSDNTLEAIRLASNKTWVLGDVQFKQEIQENLDRKIEPGQHGGDRRSKKYFSSHTTP